MRRQPARGVCAAPGRLTGRHLGGCATAVDGARTASKPAADWARVAELRGECPERGQARRLGMAMWWGAATVTPARRNPRDGSTTKKPRYLAKLSVFLGEDEVFGQTRFAMSVWAASRSGPVGDRVVHRGPIGWRQFGRARRRCATARPRHSHRPPQWGTGLAAAGPTGLHESRHRAAADRTGGI